MVAGPFAVPVPVNITAIAPLLTATTTNSALLNNSTSVPVNPSTPGDPAPVPKTTNNTVAPALLPTTSTVPANCPTTVSPLPDPTITTTVPDNP